MKGLFALAFMDNTTTLEQLEEWATDTNERCNEQEAAKRIGLAFKYINRRTKRCNNDDSL